MEKERQPYPKSRSGLPAVENYLALLLNEANRGRCTLSQIASWTSAAPARIWNIEGKGQIREGYDADLVLVDLNRTQTIRCLTRPNPACRTVADFAGVTSGRMVSPGDSGVLHDRQDRYVRFLQLDPQNRNIFTSQWKGSFDIKKDALVFGVQSLGLPVAEQRQQVRKPGFDS